MAEKNIWRPHLNGTLLFCRPLVLDDFHVLFKAASDPLIWEQHPDSQRYTLDRFKVFFDSAMEAEGAFAVFDANSKEMIGSSRYSNHRPTSSSVEIGYTFLTRPYWTGSFNRELKSLMLNHAFQFVETTYFVVGKDNIRSRKAMVKIGGQEVQGPDLPDTDFASSVVFQIKKSDWPV